MLAVGQIDVKSDLKELRGAENAKPFARLLNLAGIERAGMDSKPGAISA
jgi:hypothetical protein